MDTLITSSNPNFSIVLPGVCNCNCSFCFWNKNAEAVHLMSDKFQRILVNCLDNLPLHFNTLSITGGEPTLSAHFSAVIAAVAKRRNRWRKVVLTTNGANLAPHLASRVFAEAIDFVNISRHSSVEEYNQKVFKIHKSQKKPNTGLYDMSKFGVPTRADLSAMIKRLNMFGIPVNVNCILQNAYPMDGFQNKSDKGKIIWFVRMMKSIGFSSVCFRKIYKRTSDVKPTKYEKAFEDYAVVSRVETPSYRAKIQIIDGVNVNWQICIADEEEEGINEVVLHPDGTLAADWKKERKLKAENHFLYDI